MPADAILLVDDDPGILDLERLYLEREGFRIFSVKTGFDALNSFRTIHPDLIVLSLILPGLDGFEVCRRLRSENNQVPILAVFPKEQAVNAVLGNDLDADDYLGKPFNPRELCARVRTILYHGRPLSERQKTNLETGNLKIDQHKREVSIAGKLLPLRFLEYELLTLLMREPGKSFSPEYLLREAWGYDFKGQTTAVDIHLVRLQSRLSGSGVTIVFDPHSGYMLQG